MIMAHFGKICCCLVLVGVMGCGSPIKRKFNKSSLREDLNDILACGQGDTSDINLMISYLEACLPTNEILDGKTYSQLLKEATYFHTQKQRLAAETVIREEKERQREALKINELNHSIEVKVVDKAYKAESWREYMVFKMALTNYNNKPIRAFKGKIVFRDPADSLIRSYDFLYDTPLPTGKKTLFSFRTHFNSFCNKDQEIHTQSLKDLRIRWVPEKIIFEDHSTL